MTETQAKWENRIVGHGLEDPAHLLANPRNWRLHPDQQKEALSGLLDRVDRVGWVQDVIVNQRTGHVVDGHLRVSLALSREEAGIPVVYVDLSEEEERLVLASLDPMAAMAVTDEAMLAELMDGVETEGALAEMLENIAFQARRRGPKDGLTDPDAAPELPDEPITKLGDLWILGEHRLLCGDSTNAEDVARLMNGQKAQLMATDPPYLVDYQGGNHPQSWANSAEVKDKHWDDYHDPEQASDFFFQFIQVALPYLEPDAAIYQWHADMRRGIVLDAWERAGLSPHQSLVWVKARAVLTRSHFMYQHEPCLYGWLKGNQPKARPPANAKSVWEINQQGESDGIHPTQKPVELFSRPIEYHTEQGGLCYDPFVGSGTTIIAAERLGRRCFAMELEPRYVDVAVRRWEEFTGQKAALNRR